jgi:hopene-associated glycosyltransferase HpnB
VWPAVAVVVAARSEEALIERSLTSLLAQDYPGPLQLVLVDDQSEDTTGEIARKLRDRHPRGHRLRVLRDEPMPPGWVGKMWALHTGVSAALAADASPVYLLLTDADVEHSPDNLRRLVAKAESEGLDLVSLMVLLHCQSAWERLLIPAFVYFFQKLYPFPRINRPRSRTAGAAGGCMLVRAEALGRAGGIERVRDQIIDDCALGAALKLGGPIWVGLTGGEYSFRPYVGLRDIWEMVARSAYTQLHYSVFLLAGTALGLVLVYVAPPLLLLAWPWHGDPLAAGLGLGAWGLMSWTYLPTLRLYGLPVWRAATLPLAGAVYLAITLDSARQHWLGRGARWKGRPDAGRARER